MRRKVGIITMHKVLNFGSALQAYALQVAIERLGYVAEIIDYKFPNNFQYINTKKKTIWEKITDGKLLYKIKYHIALKTWLSWEKQREKFSDFYRHFFKLSAGYNSYLELKISPPSYDYLCIGSDQVWNYRHTAGDPVFLGAFLDDSTPKFSYASSFSDNHVDESQYLTFKQELLKFKAISVREKSGAAIIKHLTGLNAQVVSDPVFLLDKQDYKRLIALSNISIREKYILAYILGYNFNPYPISDRIIKKIQQETGHKIIYLLCGGIPQSKLSNSLLITDVGPLEFLALISNAEAVITSSFHGAAISLIMEKNLFGITDSNNSDDRMRNLFDCCGISDRLYENGSRIKDFLSIDYNVVSDKIKKSKLDSLTFLKNALQFS